jgi:hypothetical protein
MVPSSRTPLRPDRLRALNLPSAVEVGIDEWGRPTVVVEGDGGTAERRNGGTNIDPLPEQRSAVPPGSSGGVDGDRRGEGKKVEEVVEEWIVQDEWWRAPINRRYVEVVLEGGAHVVLFENLTTGEWFMQKP